MASLSKVTLIHGDDERQSRDFLQSQIRQAEAAGISEIARLYSSNLDLTSVVEACEADSLLGGNRLVVIENLFSLRSKNFLKSISSYLAELSRRPSSQAGNPVIIWENKLLTAVQLKTIPQANEKKFNLPLLIYKFLDAIYPGNQPRFIPLYQNLIKLRSPESLLGSISQRVRLLIQIADPQFKLPTWQLQKLAEQRKHFSETSLIDFHDHIVDLDHRSKSGKLVGNLKTEVLDLIINI